MLYAVYSSLLIITVAFFVLSRKPKYNTLLALSFKDADKDKIVKLETHHLKKCGFNSYMALELRLRKKLINEIKIFNKLNIVMPCRRGVPTVYIENLQKLYENPRFITSETDGFGRLMYIYAAMNLCTAVSHLSTRKQLLKNCLYVFQSKTTVKKRLSKKPNLKIQTLTPIKQSKFKLLRGAALSKFLTNSLPFELYTDFEPVNLKPSHANSYATYRSNDIVVKHCIDTYLPAECFEIKNPRESSVLFVCRAGEDKMKLNLSHTADTFFYSDERKKQVTGIYSNSKKSFGSSICEKTPELKVYVKFEQISKAKIFIIQGSSKNDVINTVNKIKHRGNEAEYLVTPEQAHATAQAEHILETAYKSRFITGEDLDKRYGAAAKFVPTLFLPTLVYKIETQEEFFAVTDRFSTYQAIAAAGINLNIVFLYSALNDNVREVIEAYTNRNEAKILIDSGIFLFFVNRITASKDAVYFLSKMTDAQTDKKQSLPLKQNKNDITVTEHISNSFPITHTTFVRNNDSKSTTAAIVIPIELNQAPSLNAASLQICTHRQNIIVTAALRSNRRSTYKLPPGSRVYTQSGKLLENSEVVCEKLFVKLNVRLNAYEEKEIKIIKNEGEQTRKEARAAFIGSLSDISVQSKNNPKLVKIFNMKIDNTEDEAMLASLRKALSRADREMFYALLSARGNLSADVYALLVGRVLGIKLVRGRVQLTPNVQITDSFTLSFSYNGKQYKFDVIEHGSGFSVKYDDIEHKNFLQVVL